MVRSIASIISKISFFHEFCSYQEIIIIKYYKKLDDFIRVEKVGGGTGVI